MDKNRKLVSPVVVRKKLLSALRTLVALAFTLCILFPIYWMVLTSLKPTGEVIQLTPSFWPSKIEWKNYVEAWTTVQFPRYIFNTLYITAWHMLLKLSMGILAAYAFARGTFKGRDTLFLVILSAMMIPGQAVFVPIYVLIAKLGWVDTYAGMILPGIVGAGSIFMLRQNFRSVDQSYIDAGELDGLGILGTIRHVLVPMCKASIVTVTLNSFIDGWNNYFWPQILSKSERTRVISVALKKMAGLWDDVGGTGFYNTLMAAAVISIIPVLVVFVLNQKHLMKGYAKNAMK